jgi:hypothetical protein
MDNLSLLNNLWKHWGSKISISFVINTEINMLQFSNKVLSHFSIQTNRVLIL